MIINASVTASSFELVIVIIGLIDTSFRISIFLRKAKINHIYLISKLISSY